MKQINFWLLNCEFVKYGVQFYHFDFSLSFSFCGFLNELIIVFFIKGGKEDVLSCNNSRFSFVILLFKSLVSEPNTLFKGYNFCHQIVKVKLFCIFGEGVFNLKFNKTFNPLFSFDILQKSINEVFLLKNPLFGINSFDVAFKVLRNFEVFTALILSNVVDHVSLSINKVKKIWHSP